MENRGTVNPIGMVMDAMPADMHMPMRDTIDIAIAAKMNRKIRI